MKYILGISLGFNASACIIDENCNILYSASEERFTNLKNCKQFPLLAIKNGIEFLDIDPTDIRACHYSHYQDADIYDLYRHTYGIDSKLEKQNYPAKMGSLLRHSYNITQEENVIRSHLFMLGVDVTEIKRINHHLVTFMNNTCIII